MRRTILLSLFALLAVGAAKNACAQHRGGGGHGFARSGYGVSRARGASGFVRARPVPAYGMGGLGYGYLPYDSGDAYNSSGDGYSYGPQPAIYIQQPPVFVEPTAPPVAEPPGHPVITEYKWPAAGAASSHSAPSTTSETEPQAFAIVLKDGSTLSAVSVFASDDGLHYVDTDARHLRISMSAVDRAASIKLNRARNLNLYLPAAQ